MHGSRDSSSASNIVTTWCHLRSGGYTRFLFLWQITELPLHTLPLHIQRACCLLDGAQVILWPLHLHYEISAAGRHCLPIFQAAHGRYMPDLKLAICSTATEKHLAGAAIWKQRSKNHRSRVMAVLSVAVAVGSTCSLCWRGSTDQEPAACPRAASNDRYVHMQHTQDAMRVSMRTTVRSEARRRVRKVVMEALHLPQPPKLGHVPRLTGAQGPSTTTAVDITGRTSAKADHATPKKWYLHWCDTSTFKACDVPNNWECPQGHT